jgi:hypothetical protein
MTRPAAPSLGSQRGRHKGSPPMAVPWPNRSFTTRRRGACSCAGRRAAATAPRPSPGVRSSNDPGAQPNPRNRSYMSGHGADEGLCRLYAKRDRRIVGQPRTYGKADSGAVAQCARRRQRHSSARSVAAARGMARIGTGVCRTIFAACDPRNTRDIGPASLEPTTIRSPGPHSMSSRASSQSSPCPMTISGSRRAVAASAYTASAAAVRMLLIHWSSTVGPSRCTRSASGGDRWTANEARRSSAPN